MANKNPRKKRIRVYLKTKEERDAWREKKFKHLGRNRRNQMTKGLSHE